MIKVIASNNIETYTYQTENERKAFLKFKEFMLSDTFDYVIAIKKSVVNGWIGQTLIGYYAKDREYYTEKLLFDKYAE